MICSLVDYLRLLKQIKTYYDNFQNTGIHNLNDIDSIILLIKKCGSVAIKFTQWMIPKLEIIYCEKNEKPEWLTTISLRPTEVVTELNRHIVGQASAKRAVAIAMRNRWRRRQLPPALLKEVTPRNVLMIGPTGCGVSRYFMLFVSLFITYDVKETYFLFFL